MLLSRSNEGSTASSLVSSASRDIVKSWARMSDINPIRSMGYLRVQVLLLPASSMPRIMEFLIIILSFVHPANLSINCRVLYHLSSAINTTVGYTFRVNLVNLHSQTEDRRANYATPLVTPGHPWSRPYGKRVPARVQNLACSYSKDYAREVTLAQVLQETV